MTALHLSRATLRRDAPILALARALIPEEEGARIGAAHRLVWALFGDSPERRRDFLWRAKDRHGFLILSPRPPQDPHGLFHLETKLFAPVLRADQRLRFSLRANPVVAIPPERGERGKRHDVVMHALRAVPPGQRAGARRAAIETAGRAWLDRQGERAGFRVEGGVAIDGYEQLRIPRENAPAMRLSVLEFDGVLTVTDPDALLAAIARGFGRARAFGCGLMLIAAARA